MNSPRERLLAEEWPTGTFGHARPPKRPKPPSEPWTPDEQAQHLADLARALKGWHDTHDQTRRQRPHLRLITTTREENAA